MGQSDTLPCGGMGPAWGGGNVTFASHPHPRPLVKAAHSAPFWKARLWMLDSQDIWAKMYSHTQTQTMQEFSVNLNAILSGIEV